MNIIKGLLLLFKIVIFAVAGHVGYLIVMLLYRAIQEKLLLEMIGGIVFLIIYVHIVVFLIKTESDLSIYDN